MDQLSISMVAGSCCFVCCWGARTKKGDDYHSLSPTRFEYQLQGNTSLVLNQIWLLWNYLFSSPPARNYCLLYGSDRWKPLFCTDKSLCSPHPPWYRRAAAAHHYARSMMTNGLEAEPKFARPSWQTTQLKSGEYCCNRSEVNMAQSKNMICGLLKMEGTSKDTGASETI